MSGINTANAFNQAITARNLDALRRLMTPDHRFIDSAGTTIEGRAQVCEAWQAFFQAFPSYENIFDTIIAHEDQVLVAGRSICDDSRLHGPALWRITIRDDAVACWEVFDDTPDTRLSIGI